jgi:hypothetical protein
MVAMVSDEDVFPDRDMSHRDKIEFMLEREGWAIDAAPARTDLDPPLPRSAFTIGFEDRFGFPELCIVGLSPVACKGLFDLVADAVAGGTDLPVGQPFIGLLDGEQPCALLPVDAEATAAMFPSLTEHHVLRGEPASAFTMLQLAWPDAAGRLPWEDGFAAALVTQQILFGDPPDEGS